MRLIGSTSKMVRCGAPRDRAPKLGKGLGKMTGRLKHPMFKRGKKER